MKNFLYTILIVLTLLTASIAVNATFNDARSSPNSTNNALGPIDGGNENQIKNATLTTKYFLSGVTTRALQINSLGNVSVNSTQGPSTTVRMIVDGDIASSALTGSAVGKICTSGTDGSEEDGYPLVRCP